MDIERMVEALGDGKEEGGPTLYCCSQGVLYVKRSSKPDSKKIIRLQRPVGTSVRATGTTWRGPGGGLWAELDEARGSEGGWALVNGPGFDLSGPALVDASKDKDLVLLEIVMLDYQALPVWASLVPKDLTIRKVKRMMCQQTGLVEGHCCLGKDPPVHPDSKEPISIDYMPTLQDDNTVASLKFSGTGRIYLIYLDELPQDFKRPGAIVIKRDTVSSPAPIDWTSKPATAQ
mmetsp:Transcript_73210/g.218428  ORF Transcript_73210/g.218428 Transcript_73210/m.218428 type:complete len:232 (-) Transcript_73210:55-750(-)